MGSRLRQIFCTAKGRAHSWMNVLAIGRPVLYGMALGGAQGVQSVYVRLKTELQMVMQLAGTAAITASRIKWGRFPLMSFVPVLADSVFKKNDGERPHLLLCLALYLTAFLCIPFWSRNRMYGFPFRGSGSRTFYKKARRSKRRPLSEKKGL